MADAAAPAAPAPPPGTATANHFRYWRLRTFVAWSLIVHAGAGLAWGVPAWIAANAAADLQTTKKEWAENLAKEAVKAKEFAKQQKVEATRKQVEEQLKQQFDKLTQALNEAKREALWKELQEKLAKSERDFAYALGNPDMAEQDLRNLEAQLQREMVEQLDQRLNADSAQDAASEFLAQVETQVAPDLAKWLQEQIRERVAKQLREQADRMVREQKDVAARERDNASQSAREAQRRTAEADDLAKRDRNDARNSQQRLQEAQQRLEAAGKDLANAAQRSPDLGQDAKDRIAASADAVAKAKDAVAAAATAAKAADAATRDAEAKAKDANAKANQAQAKADATPENKGKADAKAAADAAKATATAAADAAKTATAAATDSRNQALGKADAALQAARAATDAAVDAVAKSDGREQLAKEAFKQTAEAELKGAAEQAFTEQFRAETVPRLTPKLAQAFKEKLQANGLDDQKLVDAVAAKAGELLAKQVPELAKAGEQVEQRFADIAPAAAAQPAAADAAAQAGKPIDVGLAAKGGPKTELDKKLADGQAKLAAEAKGKAGEIAKDGRHDGEAMKLAKGDGSGDAAGLDMRERIARLAEGMRNGRVGGLGASGLGGLRQGALQRSILATDGRAVADAEAYKKVAAQIADRGLIQGESWQRTGAEGEASRAQRAAGLVPARAAGADNAAAKVQQSNADPYQPTFKSLAFTAVPCLPGDFAIDGKAEKWAKIPTLPLKPEFGGDRSEQLMQLGWRADGLYARFAIKDPNRHMDKCHVNNFWQGDTVEVWIDCLNSKEKYRARHAGQQFWIWPDGSADDANLTGGESVVEKRGGWYVPHAYGQGELQRATTATPDGYIVEFRLPAERLVDADFAPGRIVGLNAYVSTMAGTDWYWSAGKQAGTYAQPDTWGDLLLAGSDGTIELADHPQGAPASGKPELLMPGNPIKLRVTDGDMNLSPIRADKVMVTLKPAHGGQQVMVLEETGPSTGVFEGAMSTALATGDDQPAKLAVYEGERVDAVYLDQARGNGARNAEVRLQLHFAGALVANIAPH